MGGGICAGALDALLYKQIVVEENQITAATTSLPHPLPDDLAELIARRFRAISEPMRVRLLDRLRDGEACVNDLAAQLGASQQNVSKHLSVLADVGILGRRKDGNRVLYRIVDEGVLGLCEQVCGSVQAQLAVLAAMIDGTDR